MEHQEEPGAIHVVLNGIEEGFGLSDGQVARQGLTGLQRADLQHAFADFPSFALQVTQK